MKNEDSFLGIFQDPLLMLIALILLLTLPIIIPLEAPSSLEIEETEVKTEELRKDIKALDKKMDKLKNDLQWLSEEVNALEEIKIEKISEVNKELIRLQQKIAAIKLVIKQKKKEILRLTQEVKEATKQTEKRRQVRELERKIEELKEEIEEQIALLNNLKQRLKKAQEVKKKEYRKIDKQRNKIGLLAQKIDLEKENIGKLKAEKNDLQDNLVEGGIGEYTKEAVADKDQVAFEAFNNKIVLINNDNYSIKAFRNIYGSHIVEKAEWTRKDSVSGEAPERIVEEYSNYKTKLNKLDPKKDYLLFLVRKDSFEVFLRAREIAWKRDFVVSWDPLEGTIYSSPVGEKPPGR